MGYMVVFIHLESISNIALFLSLIVHIDTIPKKCVVSVMAVLYEFDN